MNLVCCVVNMIGQEMESLTGSTAQNANRKMMTLLAPCALLELLATCSCDVFKEHTFL